MLHAPLRRPGPGRQRLYSLSTKQHELDVMNFKCLTSIVKWGGTSHRFSATKVQEKNKKFYHRTEQQWRVLGILAYDLSYIAMCLNFELIQSCAQRGRSKENLVLYLSYPATVSFLMFKVLILQEICQEIQASMPRMECGFILFFFQYLPTVQQSACFVILLRRKSLFSVQRSVFGQDCSHYFPIKLKSLIRKLILFNY